MEENLLQYRHGLIQTVQKLNENYDKLIITLSGGALALSLAFVKDIVKDNQIVNQFLLIVSWVLFILSLASVLGALLFGIAANKKAIEQVDTEKIYKEIPGGIYSKFTNYLHYAGTAFLVSGFVAIFIFVFLNLEDKYVQREKNTTTSTTEASTTAAATDTNKKR